MDVLSDVLTTVRLESRVFAQARFAAPWGIRAEAAGHIAFHIIVRGGGWLEVDGLPPVEVGAGDVVMLAPGHGHTLRDAPDTKPRDLMEMVTSGAFGTLETDARPIQRGTIDLICGCFNLHGIGASLPLTALPAVVHVGDLSGDARPWLSQTIQLLAVESRTPGPGSATVVNRLCDALFVYVLRSHLATLPAGGPNWLRALVEPQIGPAIEAIHANPAAAWTVAGLADHSGMSRSAFAARFTQAVGEGPMQYLTRWRLQKAAAMLQRGEIGIAQVASNSGYGSEAAFSKAFKRALGMTPGAYRRAAMAAAAD